MRFNQGGRAVVTAQKLRLLHAGVRRITRRTRHGYQDKYGVPVNHEDMLATIMGFSYLLVDGISRLGLTMKPGEADDLYYLWRVFALLMGIHPEGQPHDDSLIPADLSEAAEFYASFVRRNNTMPHTNPKGVVLTQDNLDMMERLLPRPLRWIGLRFAPRILMTELLQPDELARVGVTPIVGHSMVKAVLTSILRSANGRRARSVRRTNRPVPPARHGRCRSRWRGGVRHRVQPPRPAPAAVYLNRTAAAWPARRRRICQKMTM